VFPLIGIVEDDVDLLRALDRLLRTAGCRTLTFTSAEAFLDCHNCNDVSCLVLDVSLEGMSGLELQRRLIRTHHQVPIVFVTAVDLEEVKTSAFEAGAVAYLPKPVDEQDLLCAVYSALTE